MIGEQELYDRNYLRAVSGALFVALIFPPLAGTALLLLAIWILLGGIKGYLKFKLNVGFVLFTWLFSVYAIGSIYTYDTELAQTGLVQKLSLLVIPILFSFPLKSGTFDRKLLISSLVLVVALLSVYGLLHSFYLYVNGRGISSFMTVGLSPVHHPTYFMGYWVVAMFGSFIGWRHGWKGYTLKWIIPFIILGLIFHVLSLSLAGILYLILSVGFTLIYFVYRRWGVLVTTGILLPVFLFGYLVLNYAPIVKGQWNGAKIYAQKYFESPDDFVRNSNAWSGSEERVLLWIASAEVLQESPMGIGSENVNDALAKKLIEYGQVRVAKKRLNAHNQYLNTGVEVGFIGIGILLAIIIYAFVLAVVRKDWLLLIIGSSLAFHCLFESMLERQSGIVFYCFVFGVFFVYKENRMLESQKK